MTHQNAVEGRPHFDFTMNVPTLIMILGILVSASGAFMHLQDNQERLEISIHHQAEVNAAIVQKLDQQNRVMTIWNERMRNFPLHKHVGNKIIMSDGGSDDMIPEKEAPHEP